MARFCASCGAAAVDDAGHCARCGMPLAQSVGGGAAAAPSHAGGVLPDNLAGLLCYVPFFVGIIASIIFLLIQPYNRNRFVRFHAFQSIFLHVAAFAIAIALAIVGGILTAILPVFTLLLLPVEGLIVLGCLVLVLLLMFKAYQNYMFEVPFIGPFAARQAGA